MHICTHRVYLWFIILFCTFGQTQSQDNDRLQAREPWITILVHGIISVKPFLSPYNIYILMQDDIHGSVYAHTIHHARQDPFFHQYHAMQELGLIKVDKNTIEKGNATCAFVRSYDHLAKHIKPDQEENIYYSYGWSALLSKKLWVDEGERFYHTLVREIEKYHEQGIYPKIRIIGYSHGGTIAAHLAQAYQTTGHACCFAIDELVLLGMPGVPEAKDLLHSPFFKKIYQIYSHGDRVQTLDFFSINVLLSRKTFFGTKNLPDNFHQIGIKIYRLSKPCIKKCPHGHTYPAPCRHVRPIHPGHSELWSFGWAGGGYRNYFPLYPLPLGICIPWFIELSNQFSHYSRHISIAMHTYAEHAEVICHDAGCTQAVPGISSACIKNLQQDALQFHPDTCGSEVYMEHLKVAIRKANETVRIKN